ncbi:MAG: CoA-binding protein, partial [Paracoccaceae bacterium]
MTTESRESYSPAYIAKVLQENKVIASVGMSLNPIKPSFLVGRWLSLRGFTIIPVNPAYAGQEMWGKTTYGDIDEIKEHIDMVQIFRRSEAVPAIVAAALQHWP